MEHAAQLVDPIVFRLTIFVLAIFVGYFVVWSVTPALHTPLMSVTNAISSVIVVGALIAVSVETIGASSWTSKLLGFGALVLASVNIFGGFLVTARMLAMYKKKEKECGGRGACWRVGARRSPPRPSPPPRTRRSTRCRSFACRSRSIFRPAAVTSGT